MSEASVSVSQKKVDAETLVELIERYISPDGWTFLRWPHRVKMLPLKETQDFNCWEGQAFDRSCELRWKRQKEGEEEKYNILLLSSTARTAKNAEKKDITWNNVGHRWSEEVVDAVPYPKAETRFPKGVNMPDALTLEQRYFRDSQTACVQFVALKVK